MASGMHGPDQAMRAKFERWERDAWTDEIRAYGNREFARGIKEATEALKGDDDERA